MNDHQRSQGAEEPLVTIVTVTFNLVKAGRVESFLKMCESIKAQSYKNIEHIIIDGASTDGTLELIRSRGLTCFSEPDRGVYDAMNKGLQKAGGVYVAFLNSDDAYCTDDAVKLSVEALLHQNADWSYGDAFWLASDTSLNPWEGTLAAIPYGSLPCHQTVFAKKTAICAVNGFDLKFKGMADNLLMMRLHASGYKSVKVDAPLVVFYGGGHSESLWDLYHVQFIENFHSLYGEKCNMTLKECESLYAGNCFSKCSVRELIKLGLKLYYPEWKQAFFEMKYDIRKISAVCGAGAVEVKCAFLGKIPVMKRHETCRAIFYSLFGRVIVFKVKKSCNCNRFYLFGFIPILKVKVMCHE
jgi:glycosyltransferase involved in cell wall biosynthesis